MVEPTADSRQLTVGFGLLIGVIAGCGAASGTPVDAGADFAIGPQVTHIGPASTTCCMVPNGAGQVLYLANAVPSVPNAQGRDQPANGELHLSDPFGVDIVLAQQVPAFGYAFSPDQKWALFVTKTKTLRYALQMMPVEGPELHAAPQVTAVADGLQNAALFQQAFFTPSGRYLIAGVLAPRVVNSPDLHVIEMAGGRDVFQLVNGAFDYQEQVTPDDTMIFANSTASTTPGVPSVEGLYVAQLAAAPQVAPALVDTHVTNFAVTADGAKLVYTRSNGELFMMGLGQRDFVPLATSVTAFSIGNGRRGPIIYTTNDGALHVRPLLQPEVVTTVPGSVDFFSPIAVSPDGQHLYYFQNVERQNGVGDLYHVALPPAAGANVSSLVARRASTRDFHFVGERVVLLSGVDGQGTAGDVSVAALDGSNLRVVARGAATGELLTAFPAPPAPAPTGQIGYGPLDLGAQVLAPVFAHLTGAVADFELRPIDGSRPIVGALAVGGADFLDGGGERKLSDKVHAGAFVASDDGYVIIYAGGATWSRIANNWIGKLAIHQTLIDTAPAAPMLDGVTELGPIVNRSLFVDAPMANPPGIYFVHY